MATGDRVKDFGGANEVVAPIAAAPAVNRDPVKEAEAISVVGKAEVERRGGVNAQGYFNDVPISQQLTAEEYKSVTKPDGTIDTLAMLDILDKKDIAAGGKGFSSGTSGSSDTLGTSAATAGSVNAIKAISALLSSYGLGDLSASITEAVQKGYTSDTIQLIMQDPNSKDPLAVAFQTRFPANKTRLAAGKSVLSAAEYLAAERTYTQVMQSYGVSNLATRDKLNSFIANDVSAAEVSDRVSLAINRVKNADPFTKAALAEYYPSLNQADIVGAVLDPAEGLPALQRKIQIGEIGGAAAVQSLKTGLTTTSTQSDLYTNVQSGALGAEGLAAFGITQDQARKGYQTVANVTPRAEFLSSISGGEDYTRLQAEQEAFLGLASAKRAREALSAQEQGRFQGSSGASKGAFSTQYLNRGSSSGQF